MPNLQDIASNPEALKQSVQRMMERRGGREEVRMNHGIRNARELEEWVRQSSGAAEDVGAYQRLLGLDKPSHD